MTKKHGEFWCPLAQRASRDGHSELPKAFDLNHVFPIRPMSPQGVKIYSWWGMEKHLNITMVCISSKDHSA